MRLKFTLHGSPRTKKTHNRVYFSGRPCPIAVKVCRADKGRPCRQCRRGAYPKVHPSEAHEAWYERALPQARAVRAKILPFMISSPVNVAAVFFRDANVGDALGYFQALADLLQAADIVTDDKFCVTWNGSRLDKDARRPRIEVVITNAEGLLL